MNPNNFLVELLFKTAVYFIVQNIVVPRCTGKERQKKDVVASIQKFGTVTFLVQAIWQSKTFFSFENIQLRNHSALNTFSSENIQL